MKPRPRAGNTLQAPRYKPMRAAIFMSPPPMAPGLINATRKKNPNPKAAPMRPSRKLGPNPIPITAPPACNGATTRSAKVKAKPDKIIRFGRSPCIISLPASTVKWRARIRLRMPTMPSPK